MIIKYLYIVLIMILLISCGERSMDIEEMRAYIKDPDNGLYNQVESNGISIEVVNRPVDLMINSEIDVARCDRKHIDSLRRIYSNYLYFNVYFSSEDKDVLSQSSSYSQYSELVNTFAFDLGNRVSIITSSDTIMPVNSILSRTFGYTNFTNVLLVFEREGLEQEEEINIVMEEFGLKIGIQKFLFQTNNLLNIPKLNELEL